MDTYHMYYDRRVLQTTARNQTQAIEQMTDMVFTERMSQQNSQSEELILNTDISRFQRAAEALLIRGSL